MKIKQKKRICPHCNKGNISNIAKRVINFDCGHTIKFLKEDIDYSIEIEKENYIGDLHNYSIDYFANVPKLK